ncbi:MAG: type II secretion system protein GspJ [Proteobacteria bacterium]|nr:MAG: type II secretion system protein GspJ [Pseudomonadota bacterium]
MAQPERGSGPSARLSCGFTLLEMVVAISIFAIIGAISYTTLDRFLVTRDAVDERNREITRLQRAIGQFERDVRFMAPRPVRDGLGERLPALLTTSEGAVSDGPLFEMTVAQPSWRNRHWHRLLRVTWSLEDGELRRDVWRVLDRDFDSAPRETTILQAVSSVELIYHGRTDDGRGIESLALWEDENELPLGVEMILTLDDDTTYRRVVEVADAPY